MKRVSHIEFLVEEASMEAFLQTLLPRILPPDIGFRVHAFQGKRDLRQRLPDRLRGSSKCLRDDCRLVVLVDRDQDDCQKLKRQMDDFAIRTGLAVRKPGAKWSVVNRLVIEELGAWYFGDWAAVRAAYPKVFPTIPAMARFRKPDAVAGGTWQAFERVLKRAGYFQSGLRKIEAARMVSAHMDPGRNTSHSFGKLREVLVEIAGS